MNPKDILRPPTMNDLVDEIFYSKHDDEDDQQEEQPEVPVELLMSDMNQEINFLM